MGERDTTVISPGIEEEGSPDAALTRPPVESLASGASAKGPTGGITVAELLGLSEQGRIALVRWTGAGVAATRARSIVDLHSAHVGQSVALMFEDGDLSRPIVIGVLRGEPGWALPERPGAVEVVGDGERLVISAKEQLVLRCGSASITLTKAGKVLIEGEYVSSRSNGVNRVKGGSVQLN